MAREPEPAHLAVPAQRCGPRRTASLWKRRAIGTRRTASVSSRPPPLPRAPTRTPSTCWASAEDGPQGLAELALGDLPLLLLGLPGGVRGLVQDDRGRGVEDPGGGQLLGDRGTAQQLRVQCGAGGVDAGVQPVESSRRPAQVEADRDEDGEGPDRGLRSRAARLPVRPARVCSAPAGPSPVGPAQSGPGPARLTAARGGRSRRRAGCGGPAISRAPGRVWSAAPSVRGRPRPPPPPRRP